MLNGYPFSLERYSSSKYTTFMERALTDAYGEGRKVGGELLLSTKLDKSRINLFTSVFSNSIDDRINDEPPESGYSSRLTYGYKFKKKHLLSIGTAYMYQDINGESVKFKQSSESDSILDKYVSVKVKNVKNVKKNNLEFLYINNKFSLQSEYVTATLKNLDESYNFDAYYVQGSYFLIGLGRAYRFKDSTLAKIKPSREGALEFAFRYSSIDLNDKDEVGGMQSDYTFGINWYVNKELKFMLNYIIAEPTSTDNYDGTTQILQARALFAF